MSSEHVHYNNLFFLIDDQRYETIPLEIMTDDLMIFLQTLLHTAMTKRYQLGSITGSQGTAIEKK